MSVVEVGDRGLEQRRSAMRRANEVRKRRAQLGRDLKAARASAVAILAAEELPWWLETEEVEWLMIREQRWGRSRVRKLLAREGIRTNRPLGELTVRQRRALAEGMGDRKFGWGKTAAAE